MRTAYEEAWEVIKQKGAMKDLNVDTEEKRQKFIKDAAEQVAD